MGDVSSLPANQLHLANIANVAYGYARALRQAGREADVLCYDLNHILSMPEWAEGDFEIEIEDEWAPPVDHPELRHAPAPEWYTQIRSKDYWVRAQGADPSRLVRTEWVDTLVRASHRYGLRWTLKPEDVLAYKLLAEALAVNFFPKYDVVFSYAYGAVPPLLASIEPYVPVEIGTLRDTVNEDTSLGRLLALAYRTAPHTIITNADCRSAADALGLEKYSYVPHPVDEDIFRPYTHGERLELKRMLCRSGHLLVAPARQYWSVKGNDRYLCAFAELVRGGVDATLMIAKWGPDVDRGKRLVAELGIGDHVKWFNPVPERRLAKLFNAADLVLDQFGTFGTFGLIGPKAMSCGTPCLLSFDPRLHEWCFSETPPAIGAREEAEILQAMRRYLLDDAARTALGARSRDWVMAHHSKAVVVDKIDCIVAALSEHALAATGFATLRRQKLALASPVPAAAQSAGSTSLWRAGAHLRGINQRLRRYLSRLEQIARVLRTLPHDHLRLEQIARVLRTLRHDHLRLEQAAKQIETAHVQMGQLQRGILNVFEVMGQNRLEDRQVLTAIRTELLEHLVRARLIGPLRADGSDSSAPLPRNPISLDEAFCRLQEAAPLNWPLFVRCLNKGTESYEGFPSGSCSTEVHEQAQLFRAFLRPYLRGNVLDVGCGPQPVPHYLVDYPVAQICGIDPCSRPGDHPFTFVSGVGEYLPWEDSVFDVVVSGTTLDHYYLLDRGLEEAFRVLRPGGHFVAWITEFKDAPKYDPYSSNLDASYDEEHLFHIDRAWFLPLMREIGFREVEVLHFALPFNYLFMSFEKPA